jgi:hypothetical protein
LQNRLDCRAGGIPVAEELRANPRGALRARAVSRERKHALPILEICAGAVYRVGQEVLEVLLRCAVDTRGIAGEAAHKREKPRRLPRRSARQEKRKLLKVRILIRHT